MNRFGLTAVLLFTLLSCSVKEDRSLCACRLTVDLSSCTGAGDLIRIRVLTADEIIGRDFIPGEDSPYYEIPVSKGSCSLEAFLCPQGLQAGSGGISVAPGESCPELYAFCSSFTLVLWIKVKTIRIFINILKDQLLFFCAECTVTEVIIQPGSQSTVLPGDRNKCIIVCSRIQSISR